MTQILVVTNWDHYQHYKDRDPPWIKLYRDVLSSEQWVLGTDLSRLVQVAITLLAARYSNKTPYVFSLIKKVSSLDCSEAQFRRSIDYLRSVNFCAIQEVTSDAKVLAHAASTLLATCPSEERQRRGRGRGETETETDPEKNARDALPPDGLDLEAWQRFVEYRDKIKKPLRPVSHPAAMREMAKLGSAQADAVEFTVGKGWTGLREKPAANGAHPPGRKPKTLAELEAQEERDNAKH